MLKENNSESKSKRKTKGSGEIFKNFLSISFSERKRHKLKSYIFIGAELEAFGEPL